MDGKLRITICDSQIILLYDTEVIIDNIYSLKNYLEVLTRSQVDAIGYVYGMGFDVELNSSVDSNGIWNVFGINIPALDQFREQFNPNIDLIINLMNSVHGEKLRLCFSNLREAIKTPHDTGFFCYRGIESLMNYFLEHDSLNDSKAWEKFRTVLNVDKSEIMKVKNFADKQRHGSIKYISDSDRAEILSSTWEVVYKFIKYLVTIN